MKFIYPSGSTPLAGYTIKRGIGVGGFGEVYYAVTDAGKEVALKHIQRNLDIELRGVRQCLNLKHVNLLSLFDIKYDDADEAWVVMEYVAGESLKDVVEANPRGMTLDAVQFWFGGLAAGVAYLHDRGIVHRDLKPGNIFRDEDTVKIGDYGLSKFISVSRHSGQTESVGTLHYMAPEIGKGQYGKQIDVYALGIVLYEMLTGCVPFDGESSQEIIMKHLTADPDLNLVPVAFRGVVARALAKDPKERFTSAAEMLDALHSGGGTNRNASVEPLTAEIVEPPRVVGSAGERVAPGGPAPNGSVPPHSAASGVDTTPPEPIAQAIRECVESLGRWWTHGNLGPPVKLLLLILAGYLLVTNAVWLFPLAGMLATTYLAYWLIRTLVLAMTAPADGSSYDRHPPPPPRAAASPQETAPPPPPTRRQRKCRVRQGVPRRWLRNRPMHEKAAGLIGSLLASAIVAAVLGVVMILLTPDHSTMGQWAPTYAWLTLSATAGAWMLLIGSKSFEGHAGEPALRRFAMLVVGLLLGLVVWGFTRVLLVEPTYVMEIPHAAAAHLPETFYDVNGMPTLPAFLTFFAILFVALRWWKQTDPLRQTRLSVWATLVCVALAVVLHKFCPVPRGFMLAAMIAVSVQLSAPWLSLRKRAEIRNSIEKE